MASEEQRYHHRPDKGETRYPPEEGERPGGEQGERDPHEPLNQPISETPDVVEQKQPTKEGFGRGGQGPHQAPREP
jgi:hypothetical protein